MKEYSTCHSCGLPYSIDLVLPDELWKKVIEDQDINIMLCPICIGAHIHAYSVNNHLYGAFKLVDLTKI